MRLEANGNGVIAWREYGEKWTLQIGNSAVSSPYRRKTPGLVLFGRGAYIAGARDD